MGVVTLLNPVTNTTLSLSLSLSLSPQCLFPLQPLKGNYSRVQSALRELHSITSHYIGRGGVGGGVRDSMIRGSLLDGIQEALSQFNRLLQATKQNNVSPHAVAAGSSSWE